MKIPDWYALVLLSLAAWRIWYLLAIDDLTDAPRRYVTGLGWKETKPPPAKWRKGLAEWLECPYCFGFWIGLAWWGAWEIWPHGTLVAAAVFAINAGVIGVCKVLSSE